MYSNISGAARPRLSRVRACAHPALTGPVGDSMAALSQGGEIAPCVSSSSFEQNVQYLLSRMRMGFARHS